MQSFPPNPKRRARMLSARSRAGSSIAVVTPSTGAAMPARRETSTNCERKYNNSSASPLMPRSTSKSMLPKSSRRTGGAWARASTLANPRAVSINGSNMVASPARAAIARMSSARSALGTTMPAIPAAAQSFKSSRNHSVSTPLIRTSTGWAGDAHAARAVRAAAFSEGGTASSRSTSTASAPAAYALAKRSGRLPGTKR